jgi:hypothetical protein
MGCPAVKRTFRRQEERVVGTGMVRGGEIDREKQ